jgi:alkylation response protein AidB-like acyl-CoA dehydrogenase
MCVDADDPDRQRAVHAAKAEAGLAARRCARTGTQVHGGLGYTWEHGLHFWLRRAYAGDAFLAPSAYHHDRLAELLFGV